MHISRHCHLSSLKQNSPVTSTPLEPEFFALFPYELVLDVWVDFDDELVEGNPVGYQDEKLNVLR